MIRNSYYPNLSDCSPVFVPAKCFYWAIRKGLKRKALVKLQDESNADRSYSLYLLFCGKMVQQAKE